MKALVVDDERINLIVLKAILSRAGFFVTSANSVAAALRLYQLDTFDLILTDFHMPDLNGGELIRELRKIEVIDDRARCLIVGSSSDESPSTGVDFLHNGADLVLKKPLTLEEAVSLIESLKRKAS